MIVTPRGAPAALMNRLADVAVLTTVVVLSLLVLLPVYGGATALPAILGGAALGAALVLLARARDWAPLPVLAIGVVVFVVFGGALATPDLATARVLPNLLTMRELLGAVVTVWKEILTLEPPLGVGASLLVAPYLLAFGGTLAAGMIATAGAPVGAGEAFPEHTGSIPGTGLRGVGTRASKLRTTTAGLIPVGLLVLAILLGTVEAPLALAAGLGVVAILVPWTSWRMRRWHPRRFITFAVMAAVAASSGMFVAPLIAGNAPRLVLRNEIVPPFDPTNEASPLAGYRAFIRDDVDVDLLTVRGLPDGALVRLATMDAFDGVVWNVAASGSAQGSGAFRRVGSAIPVTVGGPAASMDIDIGALDGIWLPTVGYATSVDFFGRRSRSQAAAFRFNDVTGAAVLPGGLAPADAYRLEAVVPITPDDDALGSVALARVTQPEPVGVPDSVVSRAGEIASTAATPALIARALETALSQSGWFSHGITAAGDYPSLSGHGAGRLNNLLTEPFMVGDSEQYASVMALMARELGLPSRVVLGFVPDESQTGPDVTFTGAQAQAWVEIAYEGFGWVPYFPTPPTTKTPSDDLIKDETKPQPQVIQPPPPLEPPVDAPREEAEDPNVSTPPDEVDDAVDYRQLILVTAAVGVPILLLLVPPLLVLAAKSRLRRRRRRAPTTLGQVSGGWDEVVDRATDFSNVVSVRATRRETARALGATYPQARFDRVANRADAAVFGPGQPPEAEVEAVWDDVAHVVAVMNHHETPWRRLRARLSRASLRARRRATRARTRSAKSTRK